MKKKDRIGSIYVLCNLANSKEYVGQTIKPSEVRWAEHIYAAFTKMDKRPLYCAMRKSVRETGKLNFSAEVVWQGPEPKLNAAEKRTVRQRKTFIDWGWGYNLTTGGDHFKLSRQSILKMRESLRAYYVENPAARQHQADVAAVIYASDSSIQTRLRFACSTSESRAKMSAAKKGKKLTRSHKESISKSLMGHVVSRTTGSAISAAKTGVKRSPEACKILSKALKKAWQNPELRALQSAAHKGKKWSKAQREGREKSAAKRKALNANS